MSLLSRRSRRRYASTPEAVAWLIAQAALISPMWLNAWGKLPSSSPVAGSTSSASRPTSLTNAIARSNRAVACVDLARQGPGLGQPERAQQERALVAGEAVRRQVAVDEAPLVGEAVLDGVEGGQHPRIARVDEADDRHHQRRRVEVVAVEGLGEGVSGAAPPSSE